jgi:hypothetical protein
MKYKTILIFCNGNVACFKPDGQQLNGGCTTDKKYINKLFKNTGKHTKFCIVNFGNAMIEINRQSFKLMFIGEK